MLIIISVTLSIFALVTQAHVGAGVWSRNEKIAAVVLPLAGAAVAFLVNRFVVRRFPWPRPFRLRFVALHAAVAPVAATLWFGTVMVLMKILAAGGGPEGSWDEFLFIGIIFYAIVTGVSYAVEASAHAARADAIAARAQMAALRAQLHPHFLFNALHTVVQLIPIEPARAAEAAEQVADLLRTTLEEQRDEVTLGDEWRFVSGYLSVEKIRFGERLVVRAEMPPELLEEYVPSFALQTLVENAVLHGAAPRAAATEIVITAAATDSELALSVRNTRDSRSPSVAKAGAGTGLARLAERLTVLYGRAARLACEPGEDGMFESLLVVPRHRGRAS